MILRLMVFAVIAWLFVMAAAVSFYAKPAGATSIVCNPAIPFDVKAQRFKGVTKA